jgi:hypothetical protein
VAWLRLEALPELSHRGLPHMRELRSELRSGEWFPVDAGLASTASRSSASSARRTALRAMRYCLQSARSVGSRVTDAPAVGAQPLRQQHSQCLSVAALPRRKVQPSRRFN